MKARWLLLAAGLSVIGARAFARQAASRVETSTATPHWTHRYETVNGVRLHYVTQGTGPVILFLHGFPQFWYEWKNQLVEFGRDYQAIALDMRGYNLSDKPKRVEDYAIPVLVADIKAFLDRVSPGRKAILVAHDWGGALAWVFAAQHPDSLDKLIIVNAPHPTIFARELRSNPAQQKASGYMNFFRSPGAEAILSAMNYAALATGVFGSATRPDAFTDADRKAYLEAWAQPGALTGGLNYYRAAQVGPPPERADKAAPDDAKSSFSAQPPLYVNVPTLVIWGEKDTALLPGNLDGLDKFVPKLTIQRIPNGSHWVINEEPETINRRIRDFLASGHESSR